MADGRYKFLAVSILQRQCNGRFSSETAVYYTVLQQLQK
jgi:hypothetical protein